MTVNVLFHLFTSLFYFLRPLSVMPCFMLFSTLLYFRFVTTKQMLYVEKFKITSILEVLPVGNFMYYKITKKYDVIYFKVNLPH